MAHFGLFTLVLLQCCIHQAASDIHYIYITADSTKPGTTPCVTLYQFATNISHYVCPNSTLVLLPGRHYLTLNLTLSNVDNFSMISENRTAQIECTDHSHIVFNSSQRVHITNLEFIGCGGNLVENVQEFVVRDTKFKGKENNETALELVETTAEIVNSTFVSNKGKLNLESGGAIIANQSKANINQCIFSNNIAKRGGVLYSVSSTITIGASEFDNNTATDGGVLYSYNSTITIGASEFDNTAAYRGGVLCSYNSTITIEGSEFDNNTCTKEGGVLYSYYSTITIEGSEFDNNTATTNKGGALHSHYSTITIEKSEFDNNTAVYGGALNSYYSTITIEESEFDNNTAVYGGALYSYRSTITIEGSEFDNNTATDGGGALLSCLSYITIGASEFDNNTATYRGGVLDSYSHNISESVGSSVFANNYSPVGAVIYADRDSTVTVNQYGTLVIVNNTANNYAVVYLRESKFHVHSMMFSNNWGSLVAFNSNITFIGSIMLANNQQSQSTTDNFREGGAMTLFQSNIFLDGTCSLEHNQADNGGAIFSTDSKLYVNGNITIAHNTASRNGGGVYLLNSDLNCQRISQFVLMTNTATHKGGGIHAISSTVKVFSTTVLIFESNIAEKGGAFSLDSNAKFYILRYHAFDRNSAGAVFTANTADYGGAVYVDDDTNSGTCARDTKTECFFQVLALHINLHKFLWTQAIYFSNNQAHISGSTLYGGLLDRCGVSQFAEVHNKHWPEENYEYAGNGVSYFDEVSTIAKHSRVSESVSSHAVKICFCIDNEHNCTYKHHIKVKKGETFTVSLVAVDQVGNPVNSTIQASLNFSESSLAEGQLSRKIHAECTNITFSVVSLHNTEVLTLYASDGPCKDAELSKRNVTIHFLPCRCPVGLQPSDKSINCTCNCYNDISQYLEDCDTHTGSFVRNPQARAWISYINDTNKPGYLVYSNCPFDYCNSSSPPVNLNQPDGADAQCSFNRSSLLCGSCRPDHSLSLGSSRCISCPTHWPALFLTITIAAALAGIALVTLLLVLNMSVAVGTLNGLIFYANVVYANKSIFRPFQESNFLLVFMSWLNLELGIDTCYFPGIDSYSKIWLQLAFPTYLILLVVLVIIISSYSIKFSNLIGKKDPAATLATLILLSYAKLLEICFKSLSVGILDFPDGSREILWLPDATVKYLSGKHIPLFIVAVFTLLACLVYTTLLLSWQWLLRLPSWRIFKWLRNPKLQTFIQTYHTPYTSKHRYWIGLLLLARILLYLVAALNVSNDPRVALAAIIFTVSCINGLNGGLGRVYSKWPLDMLERLFHWNIILFAVFTWYTIDEVDRTQETVAYISVIITFLVLLLIILYHVYTYTSIFSKVKTMKPGRIIDRLFTESDPKPKPKYQTPPFDDDIHNFNELLDMIDQPVNTNDLNVPLRQKPAEMTHSTMELHQPYHAPPDPEDELKIENKRSCIEQKILSDESQV